MIAKTNADKFKDQALSEMVDELDKLQTEHRASVRDALKRYAERVKEIDKQHGAEI